MTIDPRMVTVVYVKKFCILNLKAFSSLCCFAMYVTRLLDSSLLWSVSSFDEAISTGGVWMRSCGRIDKKGSKVGVTLSSFMVFD